LALFDTLHGQAMLGDEKLNTRLMEWSEQLASAGEEKIAKAASFHLFEKKVLAVTSGNPSGEERTKLLGELKQFFNKETPLTTKHLRLASETISLINGLEDKKAADTWFSEFGGLFAKSEDRDLARYGRQLLKKPGQPGGQASALVGKPLELEGTTVDGQPFDWASYRGKVVLVDFWATWCGPCVRELPNVKAAYEQYHARGFDVVAISLDNDIEALREFIQREQIPWVNIFDELEKGWDNPLAKKYGVRAIPMTILVGKDGNVITTNLRGEALAAELEKLLGDSQPSQPKQ
jgi:thiol-disulfide isomerase/thioredoxin